MTPTITSAGAVVIVGMMFIGRLGLMCVALSIPDQPATRYRYPEGSVRIG